MTSVQDRITEANKMLHPRAVPHDGKIGRSFPEPPDNTRFPFQRDRDRIIHTTAFRRLQGKTQVFVAGEGDHFRTRLTHTMEVAQIARDVTRVLHLNEDLAECIALAHDLGHPPFGHTGEAALNAWMLEQGLHFEHNEQSYRIVTILEKRSSQYGGLNLNREVEDGLLKHATIHPQSQEVLSHSLETQIVNIADEIAYTSHDCDDGLLADLFSIKELIQIPLAREASERSKERGTHVRGSMVYLMVKDLLTSADALLQSKGTEPLTLSPTMRAGLDEVKHFLWERMYPHPRIRLKAGEGKVIVDLLCRHYHLHPTDKILNIKERTSSTLIEAIKDYVAGMTDNFAWLQAAEWGLLPGLLPEES